MKALFVSVLISVILGFNVGGSTAIEEQEESAEVRTTFQYYPGMTIYFISEEVEPFPDYTIWDIWHEEAIQWLLDSGEISEEVIEIRRQMKNAENNEELYQLQIELHKAMNLSGAAG